ncbi:MAG: glycoside hydrolase family 3 C-terminal domain-containing protein [Clostridiales bacterium]|jgi:beta-glucosidase|nr:glycoside hydrolase family 3 C-terminal domain-containing protein [Clostridiales bacterium]
MSENLSFKERAHELATQMTLEEKVSQTLFNSPSIPRLGIPAYNWWNEALHGVARAGVATVFPQAIGMAASFDSELIGKVAQVVSDEGRAKFNVASKNSDRDIYKGLTFWSPNVNIFRDPRWGRGHETYGEDPFLSSKMGEEFVKGLQGDNPKYLKAAACAKHFAVHSGPEAVRHEFDAVVSQKDLYETYLPAFKACVQEAGVEAVMGAYNRTNGEPCCGSKTLLTDILRGKWGFKGHVTSDCWAVKDFHENHHVTSTAPESAALAMNNGCDVNCGNMFYHLLTAQKEGLISEETITQSVERLLETRMKLGLFDPPEQIPWNGLGYEDIDKPDNAAFSEEASRKTLVLLKNEGNILPLDPKKIKSIAVIGPNADSRAALEGNYSGTPSEYVTVLDGIREKKGEGVRLFYAPGCHIFKDRTESLAQSGDRMVEAVEAAKAADISIVVLGLDANLEGEEGDDSNSYAGGDKRDLSFPGQQNELLEKVIATGKPVILIVLAGSSMDLRYAHEHAAGIVQAWYPGGQGGRAVASLIFGEYSPSARLPVTFYRQSSDLPEFTDYAMKGRTYRYLESEPLYPFGYGLSYTSFEYSNLKADAEPDGEGAASVSVFVKNTGSRKGAEIVQVYIERLDAPEEFKPLPIWSLKGFASVELDAGESKEVSFKLNAESFSLFGKDGRQVVLPGKAYIYAGGSQPDKISEGLRGQSVLKAEITLNCEKILG